MELIFERVTKKFSDTVAIKDVSFDVCASCIVVIGGNAAGKSTLLKLIATVLKPDEGKIVINGIDAVKQPGLIRKDLSYVPEEPALVETLTARENLALFSRIKKAECDHGLPQMLQLEIDGRKLVRKLSKGTRRKLSLCMALLGEPKILVLDEPTNGLDEEAKRIFWKKLAELKEKGVALVIATHDVEEVRMLADVVISLDKGQVVDIQHVNSAASHI
ncbi:ABC transporter ATP-binding protein [Thermotoga sp. Ku-13t]|uniref:ABC transporter ATP-binding protein n=1 Tax=Thermotoga sp. Ku-13t TaxID=1755813 RepID=UPI001F49CA3A|nr:ABC transporter ATP-binding protein [Thermotoga sp. Ku-13t]